MYSYKISNKDHWRLLSSSLIFISAFLLFVIYASLIQFNGYHFIIFFSSLITIVAYGPAFYLHYNYYSKSKDSELVLYEDFLEIYENKNLKYKIVKTSIISIDIFMCPTYIEHNVSGGVPFFEYNYIEIKTSELPTPITINNMIYPNLKKLSQSYFDIKPSYHKTFFAYIK